MNDSSPIAQPFSKAQLEVLQLFSFDIPEEQYDVLKKILLRFKAEVLMDKADRIWDEKGWTDEDIRRMLQKSLTCCSNCPTSAAWSATLNGVCLATPTTINLPIAPLLSAQII